MNNSNCLENISCPKCGNDSALTIAVKALAHVTDDGAETFGDLEWNDQSFAACPACGKEGKLGEFRRPSSADAPPEISLTTFPVHSNLLGDIPLSNIVTIVIEGGLVQSTYATDSTMRVIVLDPDIEGSNPDDPRIYRDHAAVQEHVTQNYQAMTHEERKTLDKFFNRELSLNPGKIAMKMTDALKLHIRALYAQGEALQSSEEPINWLRVLQIDLTL